MLVLLRKNDFCAHHCPERAEGLWPAAASSYFTDGLLRLGDVPSTIQS
jgi:hypothetical protein